MTTFFDLFSGGGGAAQGAKQAGLTPIGGVEFDPAIAAIYVANRAGTNDSTPTGTAISLT